MERINYATGSVVTGDEIAHALVGYASALAQGGGSDTVTFPILLDTGEVEQAEILIGPASQMITVPEHTSHDELRDAGLVDELDRKRQALSRPHGGPIELDDVVNDPDEL